MSTPNPFLQPSFFPTHAIVRIIKQKHKLVLTLTDWPRSWCFVFQDHAFAGIGAGTAAVLCMNPLDLLKVKFQVSTRGPEGGVGRGIWRALRDIHANEGWRGLYRGLSPNVAGNATSWGLYFLLCVFYLSAPARPESGPTILQLQSAQEPGDPQLTRSTLVGFPIPAFFCRSEFASL